MSRHRVRHEVHNGQPVTVVEPLPVRRAQVQDRAHLAIAEDEVDRRGELARATVDGTLVLSEAGPYASAAVGRRPVDWPDSGVPLLRDGRWVT